MAVENFWNNFKKALMPDRYDRLSSSIGIPFVSTSSTWIGEWIDMAAYGITYATVYYLAEAETKRNEELSKKNEIKSQNIIIEKLKEDLISVKSIEAEKEIKLHLLNQEIYKKEEEIIDLNKSVTELLKAKGDIQKKLELIEKRLSKLKTEKTEENNKKFEKLNTLLENAKKLVQEGDVKSAFYLIRDNISPKSKAKYNEFTLLLGGYNKNLENNRKGLLSHSDYSIIRNNIVYSFLGMIDCLKTKDLR